MRRALIACVSIVMVAGAMAISKPVQDEANDSIVDSFGPIHPRLSPRGDLIAFSYQGSIWRMPGEGGAMTRLTHEAGLDMEPAWSMDGKRIAYVTGRSFSGGEVRLIAADDGTAIPLPNRAGQPVMAQGKISFDPGGRRLLGSFASGSEKETLAWLDLESGSVTGVLDPPQSVRRAALSADGKWIAFATHLDEPGQQSGNNGPQADVWKVASGGGQPEKLVRFPSRIYDLCWSANGADLFVVSDVGGAHDDVWRVPAADPRGAAKITFGQADEGRPSISHDGRWLLYTNNHAGCTALIRRDLRSGAEAPVRVSRLDFRAPTGSLRLRIADKSAEKPLVARVTIEQKGGKFFAPPGSLYRIERTNGHFYCRDRAELHLPAGDYQLRAYRGPEYRPGHLDFRIQAGQATELRVAMDRWIDMAEHGWFSGENHIHANYGYGEWYNTPQTMLDQCQGEDLNVCNFMVANSDGDGVFDRSFFRGEPDWRSTPRHLLFWNQEFRSTLWGHMTLVNLRQIVEPVFTGFQDTTNPWDTPTNSDVADRAHWQRGLVNYTHTAQNAADPYSGAYTAKGLPVDVSLGKIDSMDLNNSYEAAVPLWYRLLNCGFRLPASAGTDCFLNRIRSRLPGSDRAYVRISGDFTYSAWIEALRAGRSFVTNGPMLELTADGRSLGETVSLDVPGRVRVVARVSSQFPITSMRLIYNGKAVKDGTLADDRRSGEIDESVRIESSGWLGLVASGPADADNPAGASFAHTSPIYVDVGGKPYAAAADAEYFLAWIDRLEAAQRQRNRVPTPELQTHVRTQLDAARTVFRKKIQ